MMPLLDERIKLEQQLIQLNGESIQIDDAQVENTQTEEIIVILVIVVIAVIVFVIIKVVNNESEIA